MDAGNRRRVPASELAPARGALPDDVAPALAALRQRRPDLALELHWHPSLPSTMDAVSAAGEAGAPAGHVVAADGQTAGRGRRGHAWSSPPGAGLYFSYLHRPRRDVALATLAAGVAVRQGILRATRVAAELKWPNDLLVGHRKLAGLLAEGARIGTPDAAVTIGVGINVYRAALPADVGSRATCIAAEAGGPVGRGDVLALVLECLSDTLALLDAGKGGDILQAWRAASPLSSGTVVEWSEGARLRRGTTAGLDDTGALLVQTASGLERVIAGELRWGFPLDADAGPESCCD